MLIDINPKRWEEIKAELEERGKLSRAEDVRGKLIQFPEPMIEHWDICVGSDN